MVVRRKHGAPISHYLQNGQKIVHHCTAGLGRTGTVAARILIDFGVPAAEAIETVRGARPGAIESVAQDSYVLDYALRAGRDV